MALKWTTPKDVTDRWVGEGPDASEGLLSTLLADAEDTVEREFPDLDERVARAEGKSQSDGPKVPLRRVQKVVSRVVIRHLRNPQGIRQVQEGGGPFQRSQTFGGDEPGALYLTDEDRAELGGHRRGGAYTIDTAPAAVPASGPDVWLDLGRTWR